jgi:hypothetical protein
MRIKMIGDCGMIGRRGVEKEKNSVHWWQRLDGENGGEDGSEE